MGISKLFALNGKSDVPCPKGVSPVTIINMPDGGTEPDVDKAYVDAADQALQSQISELADKTEVYVAEYGVSTLSDIGSARSAGKVVMCGYNAGSEVIYAPLIESKSGGYRFTAVLDKLLYTFAIVPNEDTGAWSVSSTNLGDTDEVYLMNRATAEVDDAITAYLAEKMVVMTDDAGGPMFMVAKSGNVGSGTRKAWFVRPTLINPISSPFEITIQVYSLYRFNTSTSSSSAFQGGITLRTASNSDIDAIFSSEEG